MSKVPEKLIKIFVYGTLKRNEPNHYWLMRTGNGYARYIDNGKTVNKYPLIIGTRYNIPFLLDKKDVGHNVEGEIYEIDQNMFNNLDILEDYPQYYDREIQSIKMETSGKFVMCWLYLIRNFPKKLLERPMLTSYHNTLEKPYKERCERDIKIPAKNDMNY